MDLRDFSDMGNQIKDIVQDAVDTMDFKQLSRNINRTINDTFNNINQQKNGGFHYQPKDDQGRPIYGSMGQRPPRPPRPPYQSTRPNSGSRPTSTKYNYGYTPVKTNTYSQRQNSVYNVGFPVTKNPPGRVSSVLLMSLGYSLGGIFAITELTLIICAISIDSARGALIATAAGFAPPLIACAIAAIVGTKKHGRISRFKSYLRTLKGKTFATFKELGMNARKSPDFVKKDVSWMISKGYFPEGHIDAQQTCLMVTNDIYQQYLETQANVQKQQAETYAREAAEDSKTTPEQQAQLKKIEEDGQRYMQRIREANDAIPDTEISNKLYRMEVIVRKIFEYVKQNPDQISQLRRFMDYYMPTTDKLVNAYKEFDTQPIQGENIKNAKSEIAKTLDTINLAYEKLYDSMYMEARMDVSSDIAVLQALLAQEGLTKNDFEKGENKK